MIHTILDELKVKVLQLQFIERYGGLVIPVTSRAEDEDGRDISVTFPVSCDAEGRACYLSNNYYDLAPNDQYRSVAYWEIQGDMTSFVPVRGNRTAWHGFRQTARLVVWLNSLKLGDAKNCNTTGDYLSILAINALQGVHDVKEVGYTDKARVRMVRKLRKSMDIFSAYSYSNRTELMLYPYDFFAIDFEVEWFVKRNCVPPETIYKKICLPESVLVKHFGGFSFGFSNGFDTVQNTHI